MGGKTLSREEVRAVAALARLRLSAAEEELFARQLSEVLSYVALLGAVDLDRAAETSSDPASRAAESTSKGTGTALRGDRPGAAVLHGNLAELAPGWEGGFFTVPRLPALDGTGDQTLAPT